MSRRYCPIHSSNGQWPTTWPVESPAAPMLITEHAIFCLYKAPRIRLMTRRQHLAAHGLSGRVAGGLHDQ